MKRCLIIHYSEIGIKKGHTDYFVKKLVKRVRVKLEKSFSQNFVIKHSLRRLIVALPEDFEEKEYVKVLSRIFGIENFKFTYEGSLDVEELAKEIWNELQREMVVWEPKSFRVKVKRSMTLPSDLKSVEVERKVGALLISAGLKLPVDLKAPDLLVDIEFFNEKGFFSFKKHAGAGGMPANSQGKVVSLMSSGIDSPVASYLMMRRGARVIFTHFHGYPYTDKDEMEQVQDLVKILSDYQFDTKLYLFPFGKLQKEIGTTLEIPGKVRTILYRRLMLRVAEAVAWKEGAKGLVSGDSLGQVASQTIENMLAIHEASSIPLFQPLIAFDKQQIVEIAERIGTYDISKLPCKDSCTMFMSKHPELKAKVKDLREYEKLLPIEEWITQMMEEASVINFD